MDERERGDGDADESGHLLERAAKRDGEVMY